MQKCHQYWKLPTCVSTEVASRTAQKHFVGGKHRNEWKKTNPRGTHPPKDLALAKRRSKPCFLQGHPSGAGTQEFLAIN